ncbi:MAG: MarR family transcriptional regulator [Chloroflexi bacterium]|nr:MarR family transcriptional regulator [Chloroflexota bacterium]MBK6710573.1 MarR family transcriptional regulator [Chloroflexota bacterium]MBK7179813.1 MarR family transcriptional regulator [Chloroflexota bacterium]MBK8933294.1 MarR family transcriptional regulator [Chloroflexota bacterium]MBP7592567.1 MarR family transcriptional regulator [Chloroflexota bacterium]
MTQQEMDLEADVAEMEQLTLRMGWVTHRQQTQRLKAYNLTMPQFMMLRALQRVGQGCTMSELAEAAMQVSATVTGIVDRLEERELVSRQPHPTDRRSYQVVLMPQGEALLAAIDQEKRAHIAAFLQTVPPDGREQLLNLMHGYLEAMMQEGLYV